MKASTEPGVEQGVSLHALFSYGSFFFFHSMWGMISCNDIDPIIQQRLP
jgi:hypothetical protein